jgi:hypothetical protein
MVRPCVTTTTASQPVSEEGSWLTRSTADSHHVRTRSYTSAPLSPVGKRYLLRAHGACRGAVDRFRPV